MFMFRLFKTDILYVAQSKNKNKRLTKKLTYSEKEYSNNSYDITVTVTVRPVKSRHLNLYTNLVQ